MALLGFRNGADFVLFVTALVSGVTLIIGVNAVNSAPAFMLDYYKYLQDNPDATATYATFWAKVLTFYTVVTEVTQGCLEPLNLTQFMCRFSLMFRLQASSVLMLVELLIILIMPHTNVSEARAIAGIIIAAFIGAIGRAYFENTTFALFGPCPSKHVSAVMVGISVSGCLSSIAQLILLSSMSTSYDSVREQSIIYFTVALAIIVVSSMLLFALHYNSEAKRYIAELRAERGPWARVYVRVDDTAATPSPSSLHNVLDSRDGEGSSASGSTCAADKDAPPLTTGEPVCEVQAPSDLAGDMAAAAAHATAEQARLPAQPAATTASTTTLTVTCRDDDAVAHSSDNNDDAKATTSMLVQKVQLRHILRKIYPLMLSCFGVYFVTYIMYPGALIAVDPKDKWFTTVLVAVYHFGDLAGRSLTLWRRLWLPRRVVMVGAAVRVIFVPLMVLCAVHKIPTHAAAYVIAALLSVSNGFLGTLTMVYIPASPCLTSEGERVFAEQLAGVCLLIGVAGGSLLQLAVVLPFK